MPRVVNRKMLYIRCALLLAVVAFSVLITAVAMSASSKDSVGEKNNENSTIEPEKTTSGGLYEETTQNKTPSDEATDGGDYIEYIDYSYCELGDFYVKNYSGSAIMYDPYAKIEKYYNPLDVRPIVLVLHTEGFLGYTTESDEPSSVIDLGSELCSALNSLGVPSVHCSAIHQSNDIADSYNNAEDSIEFYLKMYPSIRYIFDVSAIQIEGIATEGVFDKRTSAQILFEICGQNMQTRENNLLLAVELRSMLNRQNMSVAREIIVADKTLNSGYAPYYMTLYIGTVNNSIDESRLAANAFALALAEYLIKQ